MSDDETPKSDDAPSTDAGSSDDTAPGDDATLPETSAAPPVAAPAAAADDRAGVFVPRWVAFLVGGLVALLVVGGAGFALGRATDDDYGDDDHHAIVVRPGGQLPGGPGNQGGGGGRDEIPFPGPGGGDRGGQGDVPGVPSRGVLLGVAVESASGGTSGARVAEVVGGSPAQDAGLEVGDVITKVDDTDVTDAQELVAAIHAHESGDDITITYERDGESQTADVTLGSDSSGSSAIGPSSNS
jgi:membrane-associated protease RseP (regulator of RpoE activity)